LLSLKEIVESGIEDIEIRELKIRKKREGRSEIYVITLPKAWIKKLGGGDGEVKAVVDFREGAVLLVFPKKS